MIKFEDYGFTKFSGSFNFLDREVKEFEGMMPKSIIDMKFTVAYQEYLYANKIDGERAMIYYDCDKVYVNFRNGDRFVKPNIPKVFEGLILDCEISDYVYVIDCPYFRNSLGNFRQRYAIYKGLVTKLKDLPYKSQEFFGLMKLPQECVGEGYIFMRSDGLYSVIDSTSYKWKVVPTVDLSVISGKINFGGRTTKVTLADGTYEMTVDAKIVKFRGAKKQNSDYVINAVLNETFSIYNYLICDQKIVVNNLLSLFHDKIVKIHGERERVVIEEVKPSIAEPKIVNVKKKMSKDVIVQVNNHKPVYVVPKIYGVKGALNVGRNVVKRDYGFCYMKGKRVPLPSTPIRVNDVKTYKQRGANAMKDLVYKKKVIRKKGKIRCWKPKK